MPLLIFCIFSVVSLSFNWETDFSKAQKLAAKDNKPILIYFSGSDWCGPCKTFRRQILDTDDFVCFAEKNLILLNADFPRINRNIISEGQHKQNQLLAEKYNRDAVFPVTVLVTAEGKVLYRTEGVPANDPAKFIASIREYSIIKR
jgi:thiol-disulfide isomerase/thioredoxin